jgi:Double-GTPase 1
MLVSNPAVLLVGGPETGKSNFLFRAWTHINSGKGLIEKDGLPSDAEYLQSGSECQLRGTFAGHTSQEVQVISNIPIRLRSDPHKRGLLAVPDIDGEQIDRIYHARKWSDDWELLITQDTAYLFFVRVNSPQTVAPLDWITCHTLYGGAPAAVTPPATPGSGAPNATEVTVETPTQVILVDWLQFIRHALHDKYPNGSRPRVGIVVTAWDSVPTDFQGGPSEWIRENMPLLHQFCSTNDDVFDFSFFGSSIFAGDPANDPEFAGELVHADPRTKGYIRYSQPNRESPDFTIPIAWALNWESVT